MFFEDRNGVPIAHEEFADGRMDAEQASKHFDCSVDALQKLCASINAEKVSVIVDTTSPPPEISAHDKLRAAWEKDFKRRKEQLFELRYKFLGPEMFEQFIDFCRDKKLNPWCNQAYAKVEADLKTGLPKLIVMVGIEGLRLIAHRTGEYAGIDAPVFSDERDGHFQKVSHTAYRLLDGRRMPFTAMIFRKDYYPGEGVDLMWEEMEHVCMDRCGEATVLRKTFPDELGGIYTPEEMSQSKRRERKYPIMRMVSENDPQTLRQLELAMVEEFQLRDESRRRSIVDKFRSIMPMIADTPEFYAKVWQAISSNPRDYGIGMAEAN